MKIKFEDFLNERFWWQSKNVSPNQTKITSFGTHKIDDKIEFNTPQGILSYTVGYRFLLEKNRHHNRIFDYLNIKNKREFCSKAYGYNAQSGLFPPYNDNDMKAANNIIIALKNKCDELNNVTERFWWQNKSKSEDQLEILVDPKQLLSAIDNENIDKVKCLVTQIEDINIKINGTYFIINACIIGNEEIVKILIENGSNLDVIDSSYDCPLTISIKSDNFDMVKILLDAGANPNIKLKNDHTPLSISACENSVEFIKLLLKAGADVNYENENDRTALIYASEYDSYDSFIELLKGGAKLKNDNIDFVDAAGWFMRGLLQEVDEQKTLISIRPDMAKFLFDKGILCEELKYLYKFKKNNLFSKKKTKK